MATQTSSVDAVIAALRAVLQEAERGGGALPTRVVNRWIGQLPGAWRGRWRHLRLRGDAFGKAPRDTIVAHLRATLAYLEAQRDTLSKPRRWRLLFGKPKRMPVRVAYAPARITPSHPEPQQTDEDEETQPRPKWLN